ncbi:unnamed protein product [Cochlearia groenlandica]
MLSPELHCPSRSEPERLSIVLWSPNPTDSEAREEEATNREISRRRSTRLSCNSTKESGGEGGASPPHLRMLTNGGQVRRSPRFTPVGEKFDGVGSVPVKGKFRSRKRKSNISALVKVSSLRDYNVAYFDAIEVAVIASIRSPRLSAIVENGHRETLHTKKSCGPALCGVEQVKGPEKITQISENGNCSEAIKKCQSNRHVSSKQELLNFPSGYIKPTVNGTRSKTLEKPRSSDFNGDDIHISSLESSENGTRNGLTMVTVTVEQESMMFSLQGKTNDCNAADKGITEETHTNSTLLYLSDSDEMPAKKIKHSVEYSFTKSSNGDIPIQAACESALYSGGYESPVSLDMNSPTTLTKGEGEEMTRVAVHEHHEHSAYFFIGEPISREEAKERWRWRYDLKESKSRRRGQQSEDDEDKIVSNVECHYAQAKVDGHIFNLGDFANVKGEEEEKHVGKIVEFFKTTDGESYFRVQWFYRAVDTVMKQQATYHDTRRLFYSTVMNDNPIDCLISKVTVLQVSPMAELKPDSIKYDFYFEMEYCVEYSTFQTLRYHRSTENKLECYADVVPTESTEPLSESKKFGEELLVLDLYSGCGGMSTGLSLGAKISGVDVVTKWAVDQNLAACESLKLNHPQTQVRNDAAGDFLQLLKEWEKLCDRYLFDNDHTTAPLRSVNSTRETTESSSSSDSDSEPEEFEVEKLVDICYGDPDKTGDCGLKFKVHWKGYSSNEDSWEPAEELSNCEDAMREFVTNGFKTKILPLPGGVGVICGGPPCQGISGYNRYRNVESPLTDERNQQIIVFMDIVEYLKPAFVLMENVVDILRLDKGSLGRYALSRLVNMRYQARLGIMTAGCYGLSQFRSRVFMWGASPTMNLPPFPLPTHDVIVRYGLPLEFERNVVAYDEGQPRKLERALVLKDAITDLPHVSNNEVRENMPYESLPETDFQRYIRSTKYEMTGSALDKCAERKMVLHDHRPFNINEDDYMRVCQIPKRKGANFRDLPGIIVRNNNTICLDPSMKPVILPSGRPLIPGYVFTFQKGKSKRPFGRLWWDETVPTVLTVPSCHNQTLLHPEQDRILTIRESARLQGFPDYFQFCGTVKQRYCQIGNAVAVSVSRALGYSLGMAFRGVAREEHLLKLPQNFSHSSYLELQETIPH